MASPAKQGSSTKKPIDMGTLNHNNMAKSLLPKRLKDSVRLVKSTKVPPVRSFPGEVHLPIKKTTDEPGYDIMGDTLAKSINAEISKEELMHANDFLKIDQSKLPLDMFDSLEHQDRDKCPQEWVEMGNGAYTPFYHLGSWIWREVKVFDYDEEKGEYNIQFLPNGIKKSATRLNLRFNAEDQEAFEERRQIAIDARNEAKQIMRLDHFISQQSKDHVRPIRQQNLRRIHALTISGLPKWPEQFPFPEQGSALGNLLQTSTSELILWYLHVMKNCVLQANLTNKQYINSGVVERFTQLKLPPYPPKPPVPRIGKVECPEYLYNDRKQRIENLHCSYHKEVLAVYRWLHDSWHTKFQHWQFVDTVLPKLDLPCSLDVFRKMQVKKSDGMAILLKTDFRRAFMDQLLDCVQDIFDFFQSNMAVYRNGALYKLFRVLDLQLSEFLRRSLLSSLAAWQGMVEKYTQVEGVSDEKEWDKDTECPPTARLTDLRFQVTNRVCLFNIELRVATSDGDANRVVLEPSLEDLQQTYLQAIERMVACVRGVTSVDNDAVSLLLLEPRTLLNVGAGDPLYADLDLAIKHTKGNISAMIAAAMKRPLQLSEMFQEYIWLLDEDVDEYLDNFMVSEHRRTKEEFLEELEKHNTAMKRINAIAYRYEAFGLVRVDTESARSFLYTRALEKRDGLLNKMVLSSRETNTYVLSQYNSILERIAEKPVNEKQLADLRAFIEESKGTVEELKKLVSGARGMLSVLDTYSVPLPIEDMSLSWSTLEYPSKVEVKGRDQEFALEAEKTRMMDNLVREKDKFEKEIEALGTLVQGAIALSDYADQERITEKVNNLVDEIEKAKKLGQDFNMREKVFGFPPTEYFTLDSYTETIGPFYNLWTMVSDFRTSKIEWLSGDFKGLDGKLIEESVTKWWKDSFKLSRQLDDDGFAEVSACALALREDTGAFRKHLPVIQALASKALNRRHWQELSALLDTGGVDIDPMEGELTLQMLLDLKAADNIEKILEITVRAEKEYNLERGMVAMKKEWDIIEFVVKAYKETGTCTVSGIDDIMTLLDDHIVKTQTMRGSPYVHPIEVQMKEWEKRLKYAQGLLDQWITCQRTWMYLEPIFGSDDIMKQLPKEGARFKRVDQVWRKALAACELDPNFMVQANPENKLEEKFKRCNQDLDEITKGLNDYLETKRLYFPRFFFLSNDELLEILSQTKDPNAVQPHLGKCFEGINKVKFEEDLKITQMISAEGERITMDKCVDPESSNNKGNVEKWLLELESIQWDSLRTYTVASMEDYKKTKRRDWMISHPGQVVIGVSSLFWTLDVSTSLRAGTNEAVKNCRDRLTTQLSDIVELVRGKLDKLQRKTLGALTTIDVHNRDVVAQMVNINCHDITDFVWVSQLRYYWEDSWKDGQAIKKGDKTVITRIVNARCLYGYEYLGNSVRLVITPLTDRCYRTMIGAVDLLYGGAPEGPAGTGKTETVKDLSKAVAIHCVVFNCSDGLDYLAMGKFFKGLAGCGSWACFDEFNRINIEVLSVIAQQILMINQAKREAKDMFHFEGSYMKLNQNCNVFITMNPGYAGRAELPDNLKALFRPCAMMVPDYGMIGEIRLYSFGFEAARDNAQKIVRVLQLSSEQLSAQKHYDYGMRAVNSILVAAGNLREQLGNNPEWSESRIVLRSINDVNLAKFLVEDLPLFAGITSDLFPGITLPKAEYGALTGAIQNVCDEGIEIAPGNTIKIENKIEFSTKVIQLYEMLLVRHGIMVVGSTCSGKTASIHTLAKAMTKATSDGAEGFSKVQIITLNPKSVTSGQLYGLFDENTHEFVDGILAISFRNASKDTSPHRKWLLFDGPVDAVWIENMNTVLDDNKKLCLTSGEIVKMSDTMTMYFEAEDLEQASPATVSRVGMIFCETRNIGWQAPRNIWVKNSLTEAVSAHTELILMLFDWVFPMIVYLIQKHCKMPTHMAQQELIFMLLRLLKCILDFDDGCCSDMPKAIEGAFFFCLTWAIGAVVDGDGRGKFDRMLRQIMAGSVYDTPEYADFAIKNPDYVADKERRCSVMPPDEGVIYDYVFDVKTGRWQGWMEGLPTFKIDREAKFVNIVVPTIDTIRNEYVVEKLLLKGFHVMCTGDTGTGKTVCVRNKLLGGMPEHYVSIFLTFSAQTSANMTQDLIDCKLDKRRKGVLGPPLGQRCVVFVDDLNMPAKEVYGAQPPIEILRQWMDHQGWYDRKEMEFKRLVDVQFTAAMGPPGGGRTKITQRYVRHFNVINFTNFSDASLARVFGTILDWRLSQGFSGPVKQLSENTVLATINVYNEIAASLLPTPSKSHYTFNLRDLSKVFQGVLQGDAQSVKEKDQFIRLWAHECLRVFHDRLIDDTDRKWFLALIAKITKSSFNLDYNKVKGPNESIVFGNFADRKSTLKPYVEIIDRVSLSAVMVDYLDDYNQMTTKPMTLVLFESAIEHVARISRIINQPYGNALLVGVGGSGRKSLTTLAVSVADYELFTIEITKSYGLFDWREDIKKMMLKAGQDDIPTVFMIDDTQIVKETFLEDINGILNTGEVANLFAPEEMSALVEALNKPAIEAGVNTAVQAEMFNFFVSRVRTNLHLVIALSPIGEAFRTRLRMFPSLVNCCTIDWFTEWPEPALRSVADFFLATIELEDHVKAGVVDVCVDMQQRVVALSQAYKKEMNRNYYVTPTSYLELINTFKLLLNAQRTQVFDAKARYDNGLQKLLETADQVAEMQIALEALQPKLQESTVATEALLVVITEDRKEAAAKSVVVEADAAKCAVVADAAEKLAAECEAGLAEALPALAAAENALKSLDKSDITEMKAMKKPSAAIKMTMAGVAVLMGVKPDKKCKEGDARIDPYWVPATKELLNDSKFLHRLVSFAKDDIKPETIALAKQFTDDPEFEPDVVAKKGSQAAAGLAKWVHAMVIYYRVAKEIAPKRAALKEAEAEKDAALASLAIQQADLKEVKDKVEALEVSLTEAQNKKEALAREVKDCEAKLVRADALIKGLGGERTRWTDMSKKLAETYDNVTGDIVLSAGVIAYLGAFLTNYRENAVKQWAALLSKKNIVCSKSFTLAETLGSPIEVRSWIINKLPNDAFSIENAIMLQKSNRWPLMIDPQGQANRWIKKMEEARGLKVVKQSQATFVRTLVNSIPFGTPVLLENVPENLDPILEPLLLKRIVVSGGVANIRLGDATVEYDYKFKLYITTKLMNPHYPPELCVKVNLLNFMATADGLQDQILGRLFALERREDEAVRQQMIIDDAEYQRQLKEIEDKILTLLKNAEGNILDDEVLIDTLGDSKKTSDIIQEKVKFAEQKNITINKARKGFVPVAFQASQLFFCIADLAAVDPMYQYSLEWFISLFEQSVGKANKSNNPEERLRNLNECFTFMLYNNVCRSLFEKDKLLFSFLLCTKILLGQHRLDAAELRYFLQGNTSMDLSMPNPAVAWLSDKCWGDILGMCDLPAFKTFLPSFLGKLPEWEKVSHSSSPAELIQPIVGDAYDSFKELMILRCLRPDCVVPGIQEYISNMLAPKYIEPPPFEIKKCFADSSKFTPLIFVLTPGAAPMTELTKLADEMGFGSKLLAISLGQGQGPIAEGAIQNAVDKGTWVCLQNAHLCISWMPTLERICEEFSDDMHPDFRLWLTSEPSPEFPAFVLQNGIKMTNEPPKGLRANLLGSLSSIDPATFETCNRKDEFKKIVFGLCFFHAAVIERRKFGPLGWNIKYVFSNPDLKISADQLRIFLDDLRDSDPVPFPALAYLVGECNYGGRVTDDKDRRCVMNVLDDFYTNSIFNDEYRFSASGIYYAPPAGSLEDFKDYTRNLPLNEGPEVFGLHDNANISCAISETNMILDTALSLQPRKASGEGKSWGEILEDLCHDIAGRVPVEFDIERALILFPVRYEESMNTVLTQEIMRFNTLVHQITSTLKDIRKAIKGLVVMSSELEEMGNSMVIGKVPVMWAKVAYPSLKPLGPWVTDFLERITFLSDWMESGTTPNVFWVSGFFFAQAFITGTLQNFARKYGIPIDTAEFDFGVLTSDEVARAAFKKPEDGAYIRGLFLEGARWDATLHAVDESHPRELFTPMPYIHISPKVKEHIPVVEGIPEHYTGSRAGTAHVYMCPVYRTSFRQGALSTTGHSTNFVMFIRLPIQLMHKQKHWVKRGVAMLTQLDT